MNHDMLQPLSPISRTASGALSTCAHLGAGSYTPTPGPTTTPTLDLGTMKCFHPCILVPKPLPSRPGLGT